MTAAAEENYVVQLNDVRFVANKRYGEFQSLRNGPWGFMAKAIFSTSKQPVTIHQVKNVFQKPSREITQLLHVLQRLRSLKGQQHILTVFDIYSDPPTAIPADGHIEHPHYGDSFIQDLYIVTRFVDTDFNVFLNSSLPLQDSDIQYCLFQLLRGAQNLHDTVHLSLGDVNPSTILGQKSTNEFMYSSFGIRDTALTTQMRAMRSPERLYSESYPPGDYRPSDVWSIGCLFAALLSHSSSFFKGTSDREILTDMVRKLGWVTYDHVVTWEFLRHGHSPAYTDIISILKEEEELHDDVAGPRFASYFPLSVNQDALDLLQQMLRPIPNTRISIADALRHPYLQNYHNPFTDFHDPRRLDSQQVVPTDGSVVGGFSPPVSMKSLNGLPHLERYLSGQGSSAHLLAPHLAKSASFQHHVMSVNMLDDESLLTLAQLQQLWYEEIAKYHRLFVHQQSAVTPLLHPVVVDPSHNIGSPPILTPVPHLDAHHQPSLLHINSKSPLRGNGAFPVIEDHSHVHGHNDFHLSDVDVFSHRDLLHQTHSFHNNKDANNANNVRYPSPHQPQALQPLPHLPLTSSDPAHHYHGQHSHRSYHVLSDKEANTLEESRALTAVPGEHYHLYHDHDHDHNRDGVCHEPYCHDHDHGHDHDFEDQKNTPYSSRYSSSNRYIPDDKYDANYLAKMYSSSSTKHVMFPDEKKQQLAEAERDWVRHHLAESKATDSSPIDRHQHESYSSPSTFGHRVTLPSIHGHDHDCNYDYDHHDHDHIHSRLLLDEKKEDEMKWEHHRSSSRKF